MKKIDIVNRPKFNKAVMECVSRSISACIDCGAEYDEIYLEHKWENRLADMQNASTASTADFINYADANFTF